MRASAKNLAVAVLVAASGCSRDAPRGAANGARSFDSVAAARGRAVSANRGGFVGNRYESLPRGVTYVSGAVLATTRGGPEYELARLQTPRGEMIWFDSLSHTSRATPTRVVRAELKVPPLSRDERVFLASCDVSGKLDDHVVAIVVNEPNVTKFTKIRQAWRVNVERGQFELIPVAGITCEEPGAG
jgi:outer membrane protein assembly factor BamB